MKNKSDAAFFVALVTIVGVTTALDYTGRTDDIYAYFRGPDTPRRAAGVFDDAYYQSEQNKAAYKDWRKRQEEAIAKGKREREAKAAIAAAEKESFERRQAKE